ncbi:MAG: suppressor of fused domain protein [Crocinitomicaceae bacterium]
MKEALENRFGAHRVQEIATAEGEIPLLMLDLELKTPVTVLMTNGLSDYKMPVPEKMEGFEYNELFFCLPSYWEWEDSSNPSMSWVFDWIQKLANYVVEKETWFGHGHTLPTGKDMPSLSPTMKQNHLILMNPILLEEELAEIQVGDKTVHFLAIVPIFPDEMDYKQGKGTFKFIQKLQSKGVNEKLDDFRATVLQSRWKVRF